MFPFAFSWFFAFLFSVIFCFFYSMGIFVVPSSSNFDKCFAKLTCCVLFALFLFCFFFFSSFLFLFQVSSDRNKYCVYFTFVAYFSSRILLLSALLPLQCTKIGAQHVFSLLPSLLHHGCIDNSGSSIHYF